MLRELIYLSRPFSADFYCLSTVSNVVHTAVMARVTRQSARLVSKSSHISTPTSNASPYFSSRPESLVTRTETPNTSNVEDANEKAPLTTSRAKANSKNKRVAEIVGNDENSDRDSVPAPPAKRRAVANRAYVAVTASKGKGKEKVFIHPCLKTLIF